MSGRLTLHIEKPGLQTTVQDFGRLGCQEQGIPVGGAMGIDLYALANQIVGNEDGEPALEITVAGPKITFEGFGLLAIMGADLSPSLNGYPISNGEPISVSTGDCLAFGRVVSGCRAYLAIRGKWPQPQWLGSVSPLSSAGFTENLLRKGSRFTIDTSLDQPRKEISVKGAFPNLTKAIRVTRAPESKYFEGAIAQLLDQEHLVAHESNRMGIRLEGCLSLDQNHEIISSPVFPGVIQLTHSGQPIILMADAQTTGGYPRIAVVDRRQLGQLAQLKPGDKLSFEWNN